MIYQQVSLKNGKETDENECNNMTIQKRVMRTQKEGSRTY